MIFLNRSEAEVLWYPLDSFVYVLCVVWQVCSVCAHESKLMSLWVPMQRPGGHWISSLLFHLVSFVNFSHWTWSPLTESGIQTGMFLSQPASNIRVIGTYSYLWLLRGCLGFERRSSSFHRNRSCPLSNPSRPLILQFFFSSHYYTSSITKRSFIILTS